MVGAKSKDVLMGAMQVRGEWEEGKVKVCWEKWDGKVKMVVY